MIGGERAWPYGSALTNTATGCRQTRRTVLKGCSRSATPHALSVRLRGQFELQFNVMQSLSDQLLTCAERCQVDL
jgi:hypothetical protein